MRWYGRRHIKEKRIIILALIILFLIITVNACYKSITPKLKTIAKAEATTLVSKVINTAASELDLSPAITTTTDNNGNITAIYTDTHMLNQLKADFSDAIEKKLDKSNLKIKVPIGDTFKTHMMSGKGPNVTVRLSKYDALVTDIKSEFTSSGFNHTLYRITVNVDVSLTMIFPRFKHESISLNVSVPISETVIIGEVPNTYFNG